MKYFRLILTVFLSAAALYVYANERSDGSKTFNVNKGGTLKLSILTGDITIYTWDKSQLSVTLEGADESDYNRLKMEQSGNTVTVQTNYTGGWSSNDVKINLPSEFNIELKTNQGDIYLNSSIKGYVSIYTGGGDITIKNVTGKTDLKTNGGDVRTGNIFGSLDLSTNGGDVNTGDINGKANLHTMGGAIKAGNVSSDLTAKTFGGDINIGDVGGSTDVTTMGGSIYIKKVSGSASIKTNGGNIKLLGATGFVKSKTMGGDIYLYNITGSVDANTSSGNIYCELKPSGKGGSNLYTLNGGIKLMVDPNAKATIEAEVRLKGWDGGDENEKMIESDFPAKSYQSGSRSGNVEAAYLLNGGGELIKLTTMNEKIQIRKMKR